jgi:hypothetical protein
LIVRLKPSNRDKYVAGNFDGDSKLLAMT